MWKHEVTQWVHVFYLSWSSYLFLLPFSVWLFYLSISSILFVCYASSIVLRLLWCLCSSFLFPNDTFVFLKSCVFFLRQTFLFYYFSSFSCSFSKLVWAPQNDLKPVWKLSETVKSCKLIRASTTAFIQREESWTATEEGKVAKWGGDEYNEATAHLSTGVLCLSLCLSLYLFSLSFSLCLSVSVSASVPVSVSVSLFFLAFRI